MPNHLHIGDHLQDPESCIRYRHCTRDTDDTYLKGVYLLIITCYETTTVSNKLQLTLAP
jgi:hypothetical protein